jgi:prepilin-type N-terminal cleavage/methylation domain-containing protein
MKNRAGRRGFTLLELVISVTLMTVAIGIAIPFFIVQSRSLEASNGRLDAQLNVNFGLDAIDRDLRVAGVGITQRQPLLVQAASDAITFNADLTSAMPADFSAVYYDPDAPVTTLGLLWPAHKVTLPNSSWTYPDSAYWAGVGVPSAAETISYYVETDSQAAGLLRLMRRVNSAPPRVMARGIKAVAGEPFFRYYMLNTLGALVEVSQGSLPRRHVPGWHGQPADTGVVALVDSIVLVRVKFTAVHRDPRYADAIRAEERTIRITNAGLIRASTCGDAPLAATGLAGLADATPRVTLTWTSSIDEAAGEKDVERYSIYRREAATPTFGEPIASIASGVPLASFVDTDVKPGETWIYGVAAQDCTPALSSIVVTPTLVIP